ncbi:alpha/beta fold hydrolase [Oryzibacter oryziterrae]|uniref:alpha/beta fold hydrolase n=1 Tax=Oryzibacter oryziterrae TaxID=2766474 RepID=UPI001F297BFB|nr:alpha/beta fold hydrolase [Oryzibacter oryziterrae]
MPTFFSSSHEFAYLDEGEGEPILLVHGFASNRKINWVNPGWVETLVQAGRRVIALDNRGHGESAKFYDVDSYKLGLMAADSIALLDHLGLERVDAMGYSMGARIVATLAVGYPHRLKSIILGGMGSSLVNGMQNGEVVAEALEAESVDQVTDPQGRAFRLFADQTQSDRKALAACIRGIRQPIAPDALGTIVAPTLIAVGTKDYVAGSPQELAALIPGSEVLDIPNRDHMVAVGDQVYKRGVVAFLARK